MSDGIHLTEYHDNVVQWLKDNISWLQSVSYYPETETALTAPCAFFGVQDWEINEEQPMNGQLSVSLNCELLVVFGMDDPAYQLEVRNAAMALCLKLNEQRFGLPVDALVLTSAEPDAFNPELDDYAVWSISFNQTIEVGEDTFKPEGLRPTDVKVGYSPDIGAGNPDKYEQVVSDG